MIWLTGAGGLLGRHFSEVLAGRMIDFFATGREIDISDSDQVNKFAGGKSITTIINCAAYTDVDKAEHEPDKCMRINAIGPQNLARIAKENDAVLIHFSSDYVFDGEKDGCYSEDDRPNPLSVYGRSKLAGDIHVMESDAKYYIFRISWLFGEYRDTFPVKIAKKLLSGHDVKVILEQKGSPAYAGSLAEEIVDKALGRGNGKYGVYNYSTLGSTAWHEYAAWIGRILYESRYLSQNPKIGVITVKELGQAAVRPRNSYLCKDKVIGRLGFEINGWRDSVKNFFSPEKIEKLLQSL